MYLKKKISNKCLAQHGISHKFFNLKYTCKNDEKITQKLAKQLNFSTLVSNKKFDGSL